MPEKEKNDIFGVSQAFSKLQKTVLEAAKKEPPRAHPEAKAAVISIFKSEISKLGLAEGQEFDHACSDGWSCPGAWFKLPVFFDSWTGEIFSCGLSQLGSHHPEDIRQVGWAWISLDSFCQQYGTSEIMPLKLLSSVFKSEVREIQDWREAN